MAHKIVMTLDPDSIQAAIDKLEEYKRGLNDKTEKLQQRIAKTIESHAQEGFNGAVVDDIYMVNHVPAEPRYAKVEVKAKEDGSEVVVHGTDAVFVEFGAGVYHNGSVGSSPNPNGQALGFTIGSYGAKGGQNSWAFNGEGGLTFTHGTPAAMPLYRATMEAAAQAPGIAKEVFERD